ncbi:restriction endonuclease subunit M [Candidatus Roizmanbacteria bacterium RIFCSPLOWO2_01_FULL_38_12]|uniref:site-specific DNA-methyltransferase (cytosine-N(4)-specific) n=1 Tax=Candidatus Roizmanbacteria bacterium RIFCSPLOWO2_01_FULL_38_12 TaxID=1802061 RepID=A0A1F7IR47_9BACT|nr:MAG: restriction endonuclease subunit M [Candidatus Roizmanbacteria bacterium RIFCSPHIGHO2_12_FULL_38_13]OGK45835.1 MAG: restriction endonuclease subunit M [Candidatus Roizmanbacteria bacterium RIFCSPLOWO2_01_FULL_38_12]
MSQNLVSINEASKWASEYLSRDITSSNISYLIQYGKIKKHGDNGGTLVNIEDLKGYYKSFNGFREINWKKKLGQDLNWELSFDHLREKDTTKHVHRLHPYKGKFIPQLVGYFIDDHTDNFKKKIYFSKGDIILDPFAGSGTTLVQGNELGMHSVGVDISRFNSLITEVKLNDYDFNSLEKEIEHIIYRITTFETNENINNFERELYNKLYEFNSRFFPSPKFKYDLNKGVINENKYARINEHEFLNIYNNLVKKYNIKLKQQFDKSFLDKWYIKNVRDEIDFAFSLVKKIKNRNNRRIIAVVLSRTIRSCRATTHSDLATLIEPQLATYYCYKHKKICKPLFSIKYWFARYANDTLSRLQEFKKIKTNARFSVISSDSRTVNIEEELKKRDKHLYEIFKKQKISGIFTSPPYVGQIDYHEQHAYAYDLFGFKRKDELEIGPLYKGQGEEAKKSYIEGISEVLLNCKKYLADDFNILLVANDKYNLYPRIAEKSGLKIINTFKRPVLNRTERDKSPYSEIIFHFKKK